MSGHIPRMVRVIRHHLETLPIPHTAMTGPDQTRPIVSVQATPFHGVSWQDNLPWKHLLQARTLLLQNQSALEEKTTTLLQVPLGGLRITDMSVSERSSPSPQPQGGSGFWVRKSRASDQVSESLQKNLKSKHKIESSWLGFSTNWHWTWERDRLLTGKWWAAATQARQRGKKGSQLHPVWSNTDTRGDTNKTHKGQGRDRDQEGAQTDLLRACENTFRAWCTFSYWWK